MKPLRPILAANSSLSDVAGFFLRIVLVALCSWPFYVVFKPSEPHQPVSGAPGSREVAAHSSPLPLDFRNDDPYTLMIQAARFIIPSWINYSHQLALSHSLTFRYISGDPRGL